MSKAFETTLTWESVYVNNILISHKEKQTYVPKHVLGMNPCKKMGFVISQKT